MICPIFKSAQIQKKNRADHGCPSFPRPSFPPFEKPQTFLRYRKQEQETTKGAPPVPRLTQLPTTDSVDSVAIEGYCTSINHSVEFRAVFDHHEVKVYGWSVRPCRDRPSSRAIRIDRVSPVAGPPLLGGKHSVDHDVVNRRNISFPIKVGHGDGA